MVGAVVAVREEEWGGEDVQFAMGEDNCDCVMVTAVCASAMRAMSARNNRRRLWGRCRAWLH